MSHIATAFSVHLKRQVKSNLAWCSKIFSKILSEGKTSKEDIDYFRWLSYAFALMVRERPVDAERFNRAVSAISILDEVAGGKPKQHFKELINLYDAKLFKSLKIETQKISRN